MQNPRWRNIRAKVLWIVLQKWGFLQFLPLYWFEIHLIEFHGEKKHTTKILSVCLKELGRKNAKLSADKSS